MPLIVTPFQTAIEIRQIAVVVSRLRARQLEHHIDAAAVFIARSLEQLGLLTRRRLFIGIKAIVRPKLPGSLEALEEVA